MAVKYSDGGRFVRPKNHVPAPDLLEASRTLLPEVPRLTLDFEFHKALQALWSFVSILNRYVDNRAPWVLARDPEKKDELNAVLADLLEGLRLVGVYLAPFMPATASTLFTELSARESITGLSYETDGIWGRLPEEISLAPVPPLFEKRNPDGTVQKETRTSSRHQDGAQSGGSRAEEPAGGTPQMATDQPETPVLPPGKPAIDITDFQGIELVPGTILTAEPVPKSKKLLKLTVDIGREKRTIVAGIQSSYTPEELIGKTVLVLANLKPAKLMGVESQGMILAAQTQEGVSLITFDRPVSPGSEIR